MHAVSHRNRNMALGIIAVLVVSISISYFSKHTQSPPNELTVGSIIPTPPVKPDVLANDSEVENFQERIKGSIDAANRPSEQTEESMAAAGAASGTPVDLTTGARATDARDNSAQALSTATPSTQNATTSTQSAAPQQQASSIQPAQDTRNTAQDARTTTQAATVSATIAPAASTAQNQTNQSATGAGTIQSRINQSAQSVANEVKSTVKAAQESGNEIADSIATEAKAAANEAQAIAKGVAKSVANETKAAANAAQSTANDAAKSTAKALKSAANEVKSIAKPAGKPAKVASAQRKQSIRQARLEARQQARQTRLAKQQSVKPNPQTRVVAQTTPQITPPVNTASKGWAVRVGAFTDQQLAANMVKNLATQGFAAFTQKLDPANRGDTRVAVYAGPQASQSDAEELREELKMMGDLEGNVVFVQ